MTSAGVDVAHAHKCQSGYLTACVLDSQTPAAWQLLPSASQPAGASVNVQNKHRKASGHAWADGSPFTLSAYRNVLSVCSQESPFGETLAIMTVRASSPTKLSRNTYSSRVLDGQKALSGCQQRKQALAAWGELHLGLHQQGPSLSHHAKSPACGQSA